MRRSSSDECLLSSPSVVAELGLLGERFPRRGLVLFSCSSLSSAKRRIRPTSCSSSASRWLSSCSARPEAPSPPGGMASPMRLRGGVGISSASARHALMRSFDADTPRSLNHGLPCFSSSSILFCRCWSRHWPTRRAASRAAAAVAGRTPRRVTGMDSRDGDGWSCTADSCAPFGAHDSLKEYSVDCDMNS